MEYEQKTLPITKLVSNSGQIAGVPKNPRTIKDARFNALKKSIEDAPEMLSLREQTNRKCLMMELDPHYCDVIIARWETLTGKEAIKIA